MSLAGGRGRVLPLLIEHMFYIPSFCYLVKSSLIKRVLFANLMFFLFLC